MPESSFMSALTLNRLLNNTVNGLHDVGKIKDKKDNKINRTKKTSFQPNKNENEADISAKFSAML